MKCANCGQRRKVDNPLCTRCYRKLRPRHRVELYRTWRYAYRNLGNDRAWSEYMAARRIALLALRHQAAGR